MLAVLMACSLVVAHAEPPSAKPSTAPSRLEPSTVLATVNGRPITVAEIDRELKRPEVAAFFGTGEPSPEMLSRMRAGALHSVISRDLLIGAARESKLVEGKLVTAEAEKFIEAQGGKERLSKALSAQGVSWETFTQDLTDAIRIKLYVESDVSKGLQVSDADAKEIFEKNPSRFAVPEMVKARHILVKSSEEDPIAKKKIDEIRTQLTKPGADFAKIAETTSDDSTTRNRGGDLGFFQRGMMVPEFEAAAFELDPGQVSQPVKTKFGYHLIKVEEHKPQHQPSYAEVSDKVKALALAQARTLALEGKVAELRKAAQVEYKVPEMKPAN